MSMPNDFNYFLYSFLGCRYPLPNMLSRGAITDVYVFVQMSVLLKTMFAITALKLVEKYRFFYKQ